MEIAILTKKAYDHSGFAVGNKRSFCCTDFAILVAFILCSSFLARILLFVESFGPFFRRFSIQYIVCRDKVHLYCLLVLSSRGPTTLTTHLETREEDIYIVIAGFCGPSNNTLFSKTDEVKISTGQLPSGYYPAIYEKLCFAVVYVILVPVWHYFMKSVLRTSFYKVILALILCCLGGSLCSFVSLLSSNISGDLRSPLNLILDSLVVLFRSVCSYFILLLALGSSIFNLLLACRIGILPWKQIRSAAYGYLGFSIVYLLANLSFLFFLPSPLIDRNSFVSSSVTFL